MDSARLHILRRAVAAAAALVAVLYLLTGSGLVPVTADQPPGVVPPLLVAAVVFLALAVLVVRIERRWVWIAGAAVQIPLILMYLVVAGERTPPFEPWGITVKLLQLGLLGALAGLAVRGGVHSSTGTAKSSTGPDRVSSS